MHLFNRQRRIIGGGYKQMRYNRCLTRVITSWLPSYWIYGTSRPKFQICCNWGMKQLNAQVLFIWNIENGCLNSESKNVRPEINNYIQQTLWKPPSAGFVWSGERGLCSSILSTATSCPRGFSSVHTVSVADVFIAKFYSSTTSPPWGSAISSIIT